MKKIVLVLVLAAMILAPVAAKGTTGASTTTYGIGLNLGTPSGLAFQYKVSKEFDLIANLDYGFYGKWVGGGVGVNFKVADFDWTDGSWFLTVGAMGDIGVTLGDNSGFYLSAVAPVRLNYQFPKAPWSFYVSVAPGVAIFPNLGFAIDGGIGAMYLFDK